MSEKIQLYNLIGDNKESDSSSDSHPTNDFDNSSPGLEEADHYDLLKPCANDLLKTIPDGRSRRPRSLNASGSHKLEVMRFIEDKSGGDDSTKKMIILRNEQRGNFRRSRISLVEEKLLAVTDSKSAMNVNTLIPMNYESPVLSYSSEITTPAVLQKRRLKRTYITLTVAALISSGIGGGFGLCLLLKEGNAKLTTTTPKALTTEASAEFFRVLTNSESCPEECAKTIKSLNMTNGKVRCAKDLVSVDCNPGFKPEKSNASCFALHESLPQLRCIEEVCPSPEEPLHGHLRCENKEHVRNSICYVDCDHGALPKELAVISCQEDLTWTAPQCVYLP